jgi:hypothetical protein
MNKQAGNFRNKAITAKKQDTCVTQALRNNGYHAKPPACLKRIKFLLLYH